MKHALYDFQLECIESLWEELTLNNTALAVLPTGAGKTATILGFCEKAFSFSPEIRGVFIVNRVKLAMQTFKVAQFDLGAKNVGLCCSTLGRRDTKGRLTVATIDTISRIDFKKVNFIILDEVHNVLDSGGSRYSKFLNKCREQNPNIKIVGITATPFRSQGLIYGEGELFTKIAFQKTLSWAIENGRLVKPLLYSTKEQFDTKGLKLIAGDYSMGELDELATDEKINLQVSDALPKLEGRKKIVWTCVNIRHAEALARIIRERGESVVCVHSDLDNGAQDRDIAAFREGTVRHLSFVSIFSEGYDQPSVDAVVFMRPTRSPVKYVQIVGRSLRVFPGKENALVLDYGRVVEECGPIDDPVIRKKGERRDADIDQGKMMKSCPKCLYYHSVFEASCPMCAYEYPLREESDPVKNLSLIANREGSLMRGDIKARWVNVSACKAAWHKSKSGRDCVRVTYYPEDILTDSYSDYLILDDSPFLKMKLKQKTKAFKISEEHKEVATLLASIKMAISSGNFAKRILVKKVGKFSEIESYSELTV